MNTTVRTFCTFLAPLCLFACGANAGDDSAGTDSGAKMSPDGTMDSDFDTAQLNDFRQAIPTADRLRAPVPGGEPDPNALTLQGNSELAGLAIASAVGINAPAVLVVTVLRAITLLPPSQYDSKKKEYVWGPWKNDDGYGKTLAYIQKNDAGADFRYSYALVRLDGNDLSTAVPIIWGAGTPADEADPNGDVDSAGVTVWDFEADNTFNETYDPNYDPEAVRDEGRFAMVFGKGTNADGSFGFNVAAFRDFLSKDRKPGDQKANLDYFYGHFEGNDGNLVDFVDWVLEANFCGSDPTRCFDQATAEDLASGNKETLDLRAAFLNRGIGRAEANVMGGDLDQSLDVVDCWDANIDTSYFSVSADGEVVVEDGACKEPFSASLDDLGIPSLDDLDQDMLAKLDCAASTGTPCDN
jgi:hypothetical protein